VRAFFFASNREPPFNTVCIRFAFGHLQGFSDDSAFP
jgi:hypothetical protein